MPETDIPVVHTVGVLVFFGDNVLLVRHTEAARQRTGVCGLPAGRIEEGESKKDAAVRELREESGLEAKEYDLVALPREFGSVIEMKVGSTTFIFHVFLALRASGELRASEKTVPFVIDRGHLHGLDLLPDVEEIVREGWELKTTLESL